LRTTSLEKCCVINVSSKTERGCSLD
jgi:hypothetical protein